MESIPEFLRRFTSVFTRPAFAHFQRLIEGFLVTPSPTAVTQLNRQKPPTEHFSTIYDFFNRSAWHTLTLANALLAWLLTEVQPGQRVILAIDDTKAFKPHGPCIEGVCWHAEHHRLVQAKVKAPDGQELKATGVVGQRGHCWVVMGLLHQLTPGHWCCFPLRAGLFVRQKHCKRGFQDKIEIGLKLVEELKPSSESLLVGDNFYGAPRLVNELSGHILSHLKHTAVAYTFSEALPTGKRGRPKRYGEKVPLVSFLDDSQKLKLHTLQVYGQEHTVEMASFTGLLKSHVRPVKIVLVKGLRKSHFLLFTTDLTLTEEQMLEYYAARFQIEITFRELKQDLGAFNYRLRSKVGIGRYLQVAFVAYALLKHLAIQGHVKPKRTAWYHPKGLASPARVQEAAAQYFQAQRIFRGVLENGLLANNISQDDFMRFVAS